MIGSELVAFGFDGGDFALHFQVAAVANVAHLGNNGCHNAAHSVLHRVKGAATVELDKRQAGDYEERDQEDRLARTQRRHR